MVTYQRITFAKRRLQTYSINEIKGSDGENSDYDQFIEDSQRVIDNSGLFSEELIAFVVMVLSSIHFLSIFINIH